MATESEDQEVEGVADDPTTERDGDDASPAPLPVRQKVDKASTRKDIGPRVAPPTEKLDPRFEAAKARIERQQQLAAERRRKKEEKARENEESDDAAGAAEDDATEEKVPFSFNMTGERREPKP